MYVPYGRRIIPGLGYVVNNHGDPMSVGVWDPFQMAFLWIINGGYYVLASWDDPPSTNPEISTADQRIFPYQSCTKDVIKPW